MKSWLRRIRGAIGVGLTWAIGWGGFGSLYWFIRTGSEFGVDVALSLGAGKAAADVGLTAEERQALLG